MKVLITGVSGFIGSNVARYLKEKGFEVFGLMRREINEEEKSKKLSGIQLEVFNDNNLCSLVKNINPDVVIHIASLTSASHNYELIDDLLRSNIEFPTKLLEAMELSGVRRFINTGTTWQNYGSAEYEPVNLYAATKQAFEDIIKYYVCAKKFCSISLRLFDSYGPNDPRMKLIPLLDRLAETNESLDMSEGIQEIELVHIHDICRAYEAAIGQIKNEQQGSSKIYCVSAKRKMSLRSLVELYEKVNNVALNINWGARPLREREVMKICTNLTTIPGWYPI
ncbi:NAD-dependent epimerase/dehydratase family protein, partial [Yersinia entomophaga]|uniref:NAD-dependent epimerase/dehydratase family protein n=2 Tax=Yersinia TaxID=629 RepID=UPI0039F03CE6